MSTAATKTIKPLDAAAMALVLGMYESGCPLHQIVKELEGKGFTTKKGSPIGSAWVSKFCLDSGLNGRYLTTTKKKTKKSPQLSLVKKKPQPVSATKVKAESYLTVVEEILTSNLSDAAKEAALKGLKG